MIAEWLAVREVGRRHVEQGAAALLPKHSPQAVGQLLCLTLSGRLTMRNALARNIYTATAATVGLVLLCLAALDWASYTAFVISLVWH